ncbi:MAG TPA: hypothetical protein VM409_02850, partial [Chloroflexia bacterium]|nr:hypothetical protein [Chloroflexia bacterium]
MSSKHDTVKQPQADDASSASRRGAVAAELQRQQELAQSLINSSFDGIIAFDLECRYTIWNRG